MSEIKGLCNQEVLNLPHESRYCNDSEGRNCMVEIKRSDRTVIFACSGNCDVKMICHHDGKILVERVFMQGDTVLHRAELVELPRITCLQCNDFIRQSSIYYCQYCDLALCRKESCLKAHLEPCRLERERMMGDTSKIDSHDHRTQGEYERAKTRVQNLAEIKHNQNKV